jgi:hypothetical protein
MFKMTNSGIFFKATTQINKIFGVKDNKIKAFSINVKNTNTDLFHRKISLAIKNSGI